MSTSNKFFGVACILAFFGVFFMFISQGEKEKNHTVDAPTVPASTALCTDCAQPVELTTVEDSINNQVVTKDAATEKPKPKEDCKEMFNEVGFMPIMCLKQSFGEEYNVGLTDEDVVAVRNGNLDIKKVAEIENPEGWVTCYAYIRADAIVKGTSRVVNARCGFGRW